MKKATLILILVIYVASIVIINLIGLQPQIYDEVVPVLQVECINETDERVEVTEKNGVKTLKVKYAGDGGIDEGGNPYGTWLQLKWRVYPDKATKRGVMFIYDKDYDDMIEFFIDENGENHGTLFIKNAKKLYLNMKIMATDGSKISADIVIRVV